MKFKANINSSDYEKWLIEEPRLSRTKLYFGTSSFYSFKKTGNSVQLFGHLAYALANYDSKKSEIDVQVKYKVSVFFSLSFLTLIWLLFFFGFLFSANVTLNEIENPSLLMRIVAAGITTLIFSIPIGLLLNTRRFLKQGIINSINENKLTGA